MLNDTGVPVHVTPLFVYEGVTVTVAVTGVPPLFTAVKLPMLPVPLSARPMPGLVFVQLKTVPGTVPLKLTAAVELPLQTVWLPTAATVGVGFTVIVN